VLDWREGELRRGKRRRRRMVVGSEFGFIFVNKRERRNSAKIYTVIINRRQTTKRNFASSGHPS